VLQFALKLGLYEADCAAVRIEARLV
jgi:hypothetical protein